MAEPLGAVVGRAPRPPPPLPWGAAPTSAVKWGIPIPANGVAPAHPTAAVVASQRPRTRHGRTKRTRGRASQPSLPVASILPRPRWDTTASPPSSAGPRSRLPPSVVARATCTAEHVELARDASGASPPSPSRRAPASPPPEAIPSAHAETSPPPPARLRAACRCRPRPASADRPVAVIPHRLPASTKAVTPKDPGYSGTPSNAAKPGDLAAVLILPRRGGCRR